LRLEDNERALKFALATAAEEDASWHPRWSAKIRWTACARAKATNCTRASAFMNSKPGLFGASPEDKVSELQKREPEGEFLPQKQRPFILTLNTL
jgi:hypothetical protein